MLFKFDIKETHVKLIAIVMCLIGLILFAVAPFLGKRQMKSAIRKNQIHQICSVNSREIDWKLIVLHHSATEKGNAAKFDDYHRNKRKWKHGLAYHFVIGNGTLSSDGGIEVGPRWEKQIHGAHAGKMEINKVAIGICLVGNFESTSSPTEPQLDSLFHLVLYLCKKYNIPIDKVLGHKQLLKSRTSCPGKNFKMEVFKHKLSNALSNKGLI